jgi:hypothetical protein
MIHRDLMDERIKTIFGYYLANVIWPPFCLTEDVSSLSVGVRGLPRSGEGISRCYQKMLGGGGGGAI